MYKPNNFELIEFVRSYTATKQGINNIPPFECVENILRLCELVLQPLRDNLKQPVNITSGYRTKELNNAVKGVSNSRHLLGCAADITTSHMANAFALLAKNPYIDELIWEHKKNGSQWLHVSVAPIGISPRHKVIKNYKTE